MDKPFQRKGSESNAHVGRDFEDKIQEYFAKQGLLLNSGITVTIGISDKKSHSFDLGNTDKRFLWSARRTGGLKAGMFQVPNSLYGTKPCSFSMHPLPATGSFWWF